ncbi:MAG: hypothetical protein RHS_5882 [Robinsoniella sp. RHS]|nr:MAG: hypothetical protein RHS_5882 [Robinsoniella sp. RHS]
MSEHGQRADSLKNPERKILLLVGKRFHCENTIYFANIVHNKWYISTKFDLCQAAQEHVEGFL